MCLRMSINKGMDLLCYHKVLINCEYKFTKPTLNSKSQTTSIITQVFVGVIQLIITLLLFLFCQYYTQKSGVVLTIPKFTIPT